VTADAETGESPHALTPGLRAYAVGDVHGHASLLDGMFARVARDLQERPHAGDVLEVFLGDYVDRGPDSAGVVERLAAPPAPGRRRVCLRGNHEEALLDFLDDPATLPRWAAFGGLESLASYGVPTRYMGRRADPEACRDAFAARIPPHHLAFLRGLPRWHTEGDVLFVHAGIRPGIPLPEQDPEDLVWIRDAFLSHPGPHPVRVVHGHTPAERPTVLPHRINVDTGAFATGRLTCAVLEGRSARLLSTR
jgi:serine/threonine protein phosphatase 1